MMMRNRIRQHYPETYITTRNVQRLYIADFTERSHSARSVEVHNIIPCCPDEEDKQMDCVVFQNPNQINIEVNVFDNNQFKDEQGNDLRHCECCLFPSENHDKSWVVMLEIKDCKPKNISNYKDDVINQIISVTNIFRQKNIITTHKVYGVVSIPRNKVSFNTTIFGMPPEYKSLKKQYNILFAATNTIEIKSITDIKFYE